MTDSTAPADDVWTVQRILQWTTDFLKQKQVESPRLEAELLLAHARDCPRIRLYTDLLNPLTDDERTRMRGFVKRRANREPLAYITGHKEFFGREFAVGQGVLIPRPETETLVDVCLEHIPTGQPASVCEVGFGSGCIAITLAKQRPQLQMTATDISPRAMDIATANAKTHDVESQVKLLAGDGFEPLGGTTTEQFEGIVSNPPYIREDELAGLEPEVAEHEPREALVSGEDGLLLTRRLITEAVSLLKPGGWMILELDPAQCDTVADIFGAAGFFNTRIYKDLSGLNRIVRASLPKGS
jgi:release factor glutamine methyltransferase